MPNHSRLTSFDKRQLVIYHHVNGRSVLEIAALLKLPRGTIYDIINRFQNENRIDFIKPPGRPSKLSVQDKRFIVRSVVKDPKISAPEIATELHARSGTEISSQTVRRILKINGYNSRTARRKPLISIINRKKRLDFALKYVAVAESFWDDVIFADESKFNIYGSDGKVKVWRKRNTELKLKNITTTIKHGGGNVMVWGCFAANGIGSLVFIDTTMNAEMYTNILKDHLRQSAEKLNILNTFTFYQDNDPKHKAYKTRSWLLYNCPHVLETPSQSPDCNPIENLWDYLDKKIRTSPINSSFHLKQRLQEEWANIPCDYLQKLVSSMPKRLNAVIKAKGLHTKY